MATMQYRALPHGGEKISVIGLGMGSIHAGSEEAVSYTHLPKNRIIGMGGALDSARFKCYLAKATGANINNVDGMVICLLYTSDAPPNL